MTAKRAMDLMLAVPAVILLAPLFLAIAVWIKADSDGPVFFRQTRVGLGGKPFKIYKFRTMIADAWSRGPALTSGDDPRITRAGRVLRRFKLDELPQLWNVIRGDMSLVGPRPEVPRFVEYYPMNVREEILSVPPGITDPASLRYFDESRLLAGQKDPEQYYVEKILPEKLAIYRAYVHGRSLWRDLWLIVRTVARVFR